MEIRSKTNKPWASPRSEKDELHALRRRVHELEDFIESANIAIHWVGPDGTILWANKAELKFMGYSAEEYIGRKITDFHADKTQIKTILRKLAANEALEGAPAILRTRSGEARYVEIYSSAKFENNRFIHTRCFTYDVTEQRKLVETLRENENRYRQLIDGLPVAVYTCDADGRITQFNKAAAELWGRDPELGKDEWCGSWKIFTPAGLPLELDTCPMAVALKEGKPVRGEEIVIERPDGVRRNILPAPTPIFNTAGEITGAVNTLIDFTPLKEVEAALQKSGEEFRRLADFVPQMVWTALPDGTLDYYNKQWYEYTGYPVGQNEGSWATILHPDDAYAFYGAWFGALQQGTIFQVESRFRNRNNPDSYRWFLARALPIKDEEGKVLKWFGTFTDIDEQKKLLENLNRMGEGLEQIVAERTAQLEEAQTLAHIGSWEWNLKTGMILFSKEQCRIYGMEEHNCQLTFEDFISKRHDLEEQQKFRATLVKAVRDKSDFSYENSIVRSDGKRRNLSVNGRVICDEAGNAERILGTAQDITERKQFEDVLLMKNAELRRSNSDLEHFAYVASHDLNEPLRMIASYIQLTERKLGESEDTDIKEYMGFISKGAMRMKQLIDDLLRYSRIGRDESLMFREVDTEAVVTEARHILRNKIEDSQAVVNVHPLPKTLGIGSQLLQVFQNLIENAIKFRSPQSTPVIDIKAEILNNNVVISVSDNGIGIDPQYADRIFVIFQRLHSADRYPGTGIGLSITKKIVDLHGGQIWIESEPDKGTTFFFTLPPFTSPSASPQP